MGGLSIGCHYAIAPDRYVGLGGGGGWGIAWWHPVTPALATLGLQPLTHWVAPVVRRLAGCTMTFSPTTFFDRLARFLYVPNPQSDRPHGNSQSPNPISEAAGAFGFVVGLVLAFMRMAPTG